MQSTQFSFSNYLNKAWQIKQPHGEFKKGDVLHIVDYIGSESEKMGFLVTKERKRISETDAGKLLIPYNRRNPALPVPASPRALNESKAPINPYEKPIMLDDNTPITTPELPAVPRKTTQDLHLAQQIIKDVNLFDAFENNKTRLSIALEVNLPKWTFVRDMYKNATDKDKFINDLTQHVHKQVTSEIIKKTVESKLIGRTKNVTLPDVDPTKVKKSSEGVDEKKSEENASTKS